MLLLKINVVSFVQFTTTVFVHAISHSKLRDYLVKSICFTSLLEWSCVLTLLGKNIKELAAQFRVHKKIDSYRIKKKKQLTIYLNNELSLQSKQTNRPDDSFR